MRYIKTYEELWMKGFWYNSEIYPIGTEVVFIAGEHNDEFTKLNPGQTYIIEDIVSTRVKGLKEYKLKNEEGVFKTSNFVSLLEYNAKQYNL